MADMTVKLKDWDAPIQIKRVIMWNYTGKKAVIHNKPVKNIDGNIYIGEVESDGDYYKYCNVFAIYGNNLGFIITTVNADYSVNELFRSFKSDILTLEGCMENINQRIAAGVWINLVEIEFLKSIKPELIPLAEKARETHRNRLNAERKAREEKREAEERARKQAEFDKDNAKADAIIKQAISAFKTGGEIFNEDFILWSDLDHYRDYTIIGYLMEKYGIDVPLKTKGFINKMLVEVRIDADGETHFSHYKYTEKGTKSSGSTKLFDLLDMLVKEIRK